MKLDGSIAERVSVVHKGSSYEFSLWDADFTESSPLMTVYALTGQKREEQAIADNRFVLYRSETTVYAANLGVASADLGMSRETLVSSFYLILEDWKNGET